MNFTTITNRCTRFNFKNYWGELKCSRKSSTAARKQNNREWMQQRWGSEEECSTTRVAICWASESAANLSAIWLSGAPFASPCTQPVRHLRSFWFHCMYYRVRCTLYTFSNITQQQKYNNKVAVDIIDAFNLLPNKSKTNKRTYIQIWWLPLISISCWNDSIWFDFWFQDYLWCLFLHLPAFVDVSISYWRFVAIYPLKFLIYFFTTIKWCLLHSALHAVHIFMLVLRQFTASLLSSVLWHSEIIVVLLCLF